ncbi:hypothetical protein F66182_11445 [Fusarium sp. NRRL 66182]|nr:hypothetical protein F66182_11445 [Fusarium sp. NRRL 66182]
MSVDLLVGIDVGMTGTGVAYRLMEEKEVKYLTWRGESEEKVPTRLFYGTSTSTNTSTQQPSLLAWGWDTPNTDIDRATIREFFKTSLGSERADQADIGRVYTDYLTCLYRDLMERRFTPSLLKGTEISLMAVRFLFSVPATWNTAVVAMFERFVSEAGFDRCDGHTFAVDMTEPQAVAAFQMLDPNPGVSLQDGDNVLILDAGGGTAVTTP